ncbi:AmmeMemoRadiSam system protein B [soil metagenome]
MSIAERNVYPTQPRQLSDEIDVLLANAKPIEIEGDPIALIVPDSNLVAGGKVAAMAFSLLKGRTYDTVMLIAPSHDGEFGRISICTSDQYFTPIGEVPVNDRLRHELCDEDDDIFLDDRGHYHVEGVDVQVPFLLRALEPGFDIVPIVMGEESPAFCKELGTALGEVMYGRRTLIVASADILHAEDGALDEMKQAFESFDTPELLHLLGSERVRLEGIGAVVAAVIAAQHRGANQARLLHVEAPNDEDEVGAIAGVLWRA